MARWLSFVAAVVLSLSIIAIGLVEVLYRLQVKPTLEKNRAVQERFIQPYLDDLQFLAKNPLFENRSAGMTDAGVYLNAKVFWSPTIAGAPARGQAQPLVSTEARENLLRMKTEWMRKFPRAEKLKADLSLFTGLNRFDYWDIEAESPIGDLIGKRRFIPPPQLPIPEVSDLLAVVKLRLMMGALTKDPLAALTDVRQLSRLLLTTENMQLVLAGLSALDLERFAFRFYVEEMGMNAGQWTPIDRNTTRRAYRAILATRGYLRLWSRPEKIQTIFLGELTPIGLCAAANEALPLEYSLRRKLEPRWPLEINLKTEYSRLDQVLKRSRTFCRLRYLNDLASARAFDIRMPGPLFLSHLPYSRKVFALRVSVINFGGFDGYSAAQ